MQVENKYGIVTEQGVEEFVSKQREEENSRSRVIYQHQSVSALSDDQRGKIEPSGNARSKQAEEKQSPFVRDLPKVGRNDPCPCGSGKKFKLCCGKIG